MTETPNSRPTRSPVEPPADANAEFWHDHYTTELLPDGTTRITQKDEYDAPTALWDTIGNLKARDTDGDGLSDFDEYVRHTNPNDADTDHDGRSDSEELEAGLDPTVPNPSNATTDDQDGDGLPDLFEVEFGSSPTLDVGAIVGIGRDIVNVPAAYYASHSGDKDPIGLAELRQRLGLPTTAAEQAALDTAIADAAASDNPLTQIRGQLAQVGFDESALDPALVQAGAAFIHDQMAAAASTALDGGSLSDAVYAVRQDELLGGGNLGGETRAALDQILGDALGTPGVTPDSGPGDGGLEQPPVESLPDAGGTGSTDPPPDTSSTDPVTPTNNPFDALDPFGNSTEFDTGAGDETPPEPAPGDEPRTTDPPAWQSALDQLAADTTEQQDPFGDGPRGGDVGPIDLGIDSIHPTTTEPETTGTTDATQPTSIDFTEGDGADDTGHEGYEVTAVNGEGTSIVHHTEEGDVLYTPGLIERMADDVPATDTSSGNDDPPKDQPPSDGRTEEDPGGYFATDEPVKGTIPDDGATDPPPDKQDGDDWGPTGREPQPGWYGYVTPDEGTEPETTTTTGVPPVIPLGCEGPPDLGLGGDTGGTPMDPNNPDPYAADGAATGLDSNMGTDPTAVDGLAGADYGGPSAFGSGPGGDFVSTEGSGVLTPDTDAVVDDGSDGSSPRTLFGRDGTPWP